MSDIILIPIVAIVGFIVGAAWVWRIVNRAFDEFEQDMDER